jgi:hypothetical protein
MHNLLPVKHTYSLSTIIYLVLFGFSNNNKFCGCTIYFLDIKYIPAITINTISAMSMKRKTTLSNIFVNMYYDYA